MRKILLSSAVAFVLAAQALAGVAAAPANFAGTWSLDKTKSKDLPPQMSNLDSLTLTVTQDAAQITVDSKVTTASAPADGGGAGGPGMGGGRGRGGMGGGFAPSASYKLDGTETTTEGQRGGTVTSKAEWKDGGKTLVLKSVRKANFQGNDVTFTTTEEWSLSGDGKTLTVKRTSESPRGTQSSTLVFNKQ
jgi:hypothetical protein